MHLVADIGGTNSRFALCEPGTIEPLNISKYANHDHDGLESALRYYLQEQGNPQITHACIAVACPVTGDMVKLTNRDWEFSQVGLRNALNWHQLYVINDFTALAMALPHLPAGDTTKVGGGVAKEQSPKGILGPGTGLGVSGLLWDGHGWVPISGEGGHVTLPAHNEEEEAILHIGRREYGFVSAERILCGDGLAFLYRALAEIRGWKGELLSQEIIMEKAVSDKCDKCKHVLDQFSSFLATVASDLALTLGAFGGIYIGGGIVPRMGTLFEQGTFRSRFEDKGRFTDYVSGIATYTVSSHTRTALFGAAAVLKQKG